MINADETRPPQQGGFQNINAAETVAPVSYTHLTLPTKLEV